MADSRFRNPAVLRNQIIEVLNFYYPDILDIHYGGIIAQLDERDGHVYDSRTKHLVANARAVHNFSVGTMLDGPVWCRTTAEWGLQSLSTHHWDDFHEGYDWLLEGRDTVDATRYCYGHAFVLLAVARALQAGIDGARTELDRAFGVIEDRFWEERYGLCADQASEDWAHVESYRGLNANMHTLEALLAAYEATEEQVFLDRATAIADNIRSDDTDGMNDLLWEHYTSSWEPDFEYNRDQPTHQFRPWGYMAGHHAEWAKLLLVLHEHQPEKSLVDRAEELFETAIDIGWDDEYGGFYYTVDEDGDPVVNDKYSWAHTEAIGAAALLGTYDESYLEWYDRLWEHAETNFVNPRHGNWYERLTREHDRDDPNRNVAVEPGYHPLNNAWVAMQAFEGAD
jgi:mannose/cellobiose epimerase-like protein (N-acyl-D-glucosamine 2-epimerase family)